MALLLIASLIPACIYYTCLGGIYSDWWGHPAWAHGGSQEGSRWTFSLQRFGISWGVKGTGSGNFGCEVGTVFRGMDNS